MIIFDKKTKTFILNTNKTSYAFGILKGKILVHLYWGKKIISIPNNWEKDFLFRNLMAMDFDEYSSNGIPLEFSSFGSADLRNPTFGATFKDGSFISRFTFVDYEIKKGKPKLIGLPATYCEEKDVVDTLIVHLNDNLKNVDVYLFYSVFETLDAITRSVKIINNGEKLNLNTALSISVDFYGLGDSDIITLDGTWTRERYVNRRKIVHGNQNIESRCGASSAYHNPFMAICDKNTNETCGDAFGFSLVYSGNFTAGVEMNAYNCARAYMGINPFGFNYVLETAEEFNTPEAVLVYSPDGLGGMSRIFHKLFRTRLCRGKYRDTERFVLINNWEATYFNFDEEKIVNIAKRASQIGVDTMVLDDGWFGQRTNDKAGLGDWIENSDRLPNGLNGLAKRINEFGMHFGLWFEPEMVNPDSDLFRTHPDWILHTKERESNLVRHQYTLDLSRKEVCDYIIESVSKVLSKANIEYVKWDMNRYMSEVGSSVLSVERQGEVYHRYMLGLYYVLETITNKFPNVLFESCASGGGRFDAGMLYYMPQTWTSDDTDAVERLKIQYGTSFVYPYSSMGAHVSACPNHQIGRTTPFEMRCNVAMLGQFGFELDLNKCTDEEIECAKNTIKKYREFRKIFHNGECFRLKSPFDSDVSAVEFISEDKETIVICINSLKATAYSVDEYIKLCGLEPEYLYEIDGEIYQGVFLMSKGIIFRNDKDCQSATYFAKKIK